MEQVTPPQRASRLPEIPSPEYRDALSTPNAALSTPAARLEPPSRKQLWSSTENLRDAPQQGAPFCPSVSFVPSTPQTSLESNDGSIIKTPFGNVGLWNATSPGIADTPTPAGEHDIRHLGRDVLPPVGAAAELVTPDFPSNPAQFGLRIRGPESPLAAKTRPSETQHKKLLISAIVSPLGSVSPDESPIKPLRFPVPAYGVPKEPTNEQADAPSVAMDESGSVKNAEVDTVISDAITVDTSPSEEVESIQSTRTFHPPTPPPIPQSVRRWLDASPSKGAEARAALRSSRRKDGLANTLKRLAQFTRPRTKSLSRLESYNHEHAGRVLQPHENDTDYYGILALHECPDDIYPWSMTTSVVDSKQVQNRLRELAMIERYLEDTTSSSEDEPTPSPLPKTDTSNALVALKAKKASRRLIQQRNTAARAAAKAASLQVPQASPRKTTRAPVVTPPKVIAAVESDMDVDKDSEDVVACICKGPDDGRPMIQCDNCHSWLHVECVIREEERNQLPDKWYCWKCPIGTAPDRVSTDVQPVFVASTPEYPKDARHDTAADVPVYQPSQKQQASPDLSSYAPRAEATTSSLLDSAPNLSSFPERTPPPLGRYPYNMWSESSGDMARHSNDRLDDPMTAIAATPFIGSGFSSSYSTQFDDVSFDQLNASPNRNFGLRFAPPPSTTPRKERPWTNYIGSFATPTNLAGPQLSPGSAQALPIVQTDPLFIHYEHDAPKQTAHHHGRSKRKGKSKEETQSEKGEDVAGQVPPDSAESSNTDEIGPFSDSGTADASTPVGSSQD